MFALFPLKVAWSGISLENVSFLCILADKNDSSSVCQKRERGGCSPHNNSLILQVLLRKPHFPKQYYVIYLKPQKSSIELLIYHFRCDSLILNFFPEIFICDSFPPHFVILMTFSCRYLSALHCHQVCGQKLVKNDMKNDFFSGDLKIKKCQVMSQTSCNITCRI